jgi:AhpD family alkylhydroperoxidase
MSRIELVNPANAQGASAALLQQIHGAFGVVPNMFRGVANSPAALASMWGAFGALGGGTLGARLGEQIAVAIADRNECHYCLAAHTALGRKAGASADQMAQA